MTRTTTTISSVAHRRAASLRPPGQAVSSASTSTTTSNRAEAYAAALATASATPAAAIQPVPSPRSPARITHQAARATSSTDSAS